MENLFAVENFFADHIRNDLCQCVIPEKMGSRYLEIMSAEEIVQYTYRPPVNSDGMREFERRPVFQLKNLKKFKDNHSIGDVIYSFQRGVFGVDLAESRDMTSRMIYRPKPVLWHSLKSLEMLATTAAGEPNVVLVEHNDLQFVRGSDVTDQTSYDNSLKYQLRMSALVKNLTHQKAISGFWKLPSDSPRNESLPEETNMRENLHDWTWLLQMSDPIHKFVENLDLDLKQMTAGELRVQKKEIGKFQKKMRLGDASYYMKRGETSTYINYMHELIQLINSVLCQALSALEYALDIHATVNKDLFRVLEDLIDT